MFMLRYFRTHDFNLWRQPSGGNLSGGSKPWNLPIEPYVPLVTKLRYKAAPSQRPLHKTRFR